MRKPLHVMAVGAHIIDAELMCGKTLAKHSLMGDKITTVAITAGEGAYQSTPFSKEEFKKINLEGGKKFAETLGGNFICMNYEDGHNTENDKIYNDMAEIIRREKPDIILTHWEGSIHEDHVLAPKIVRNGARRAVVSPSEFYDTHWVNKIYYAENWEDMEGFVPHTYIDVSEGYELWYKAIQNIYLVTNCKGFDYLGYYDTLSRLRGILAAKTIPGCTRAECFAIAEIERYMPKNVVDSF